MQVGSSRSRGSVDAVESIVETVAAEEGKDPVELPRLYDAIDPDALATLLGSSDSASLTVKFTYCGYGIAVDGDGRVAVDGDDA